MFRVQFYVSIPILQRQQLLLISRNHLRKVILSRFIISSAEKCLSSQTLPTTLPSILLTSHAACTFTNFAIRLANSLNRVSSRCRNNELRLHELEARITRIKITDYKI